MGRLIDEDDIIAGLEYGIKTISDQNIGFNYMRLLGMTMKMVRDLPTAYDIEAVVKELEEQAKQYRRRADEYMEKGIVMFGDNNYGKACSYEHAIEIVRKGGVKNE